RAASVDATEVSPPPSRSGGRIALLAALFAIVALAGAAYYFRDRFLPPATKPENPVPAKVTREKAAEPTIAPPTPTAVPVTPAKGPPPKTAPVNAPPSAPTPPPPALKPPP